MGSSTPGLFRKGIFGCVPSALGDAAGPASVSVSTSGGLVPLPESLERGLS